MSSGIRDGGCTSAAYGYHSALPSARHKTIIPSPTTTSAAPSPSQRPSTPCASSTPPPCSPPIARSFDRGQQIEDPAHIEELERRQAPRPRAPRHRPPPPRRPLRPRLCFVAAAEAQPPPRRPRPRTHRTAQRPRPRRPRTRHRRRAPIRRRATSAGVRHLHRPAAHRNPTSRHRYRLTLPDDPRLRTLHVRPHDLADYDRLNDQSDSADEDSHPVTTTTNKTTATESDSVRQRLRDVGTLWTRRPGPRPAHRALGPARHRHRRPRTQTPLPRTAPDQRAHRRLQTHRRLRLDLAQAHRPPPHRRTLLPRLRRRRHQHRARSVRTAVGKSMLIKNLLHHAVLNGFTARFTTASDMLHELAAQDSDASLARRLRRFTRTSTPRDRRGRIPQLRQPLRRPPLRGRHPQVPQLAPVLITTNKPFSEWAEVFSSAACVVTLVDRLIHRSEIVQLDGESYRLKEAREHSAKRSKARSRRTAKSRPSGGTSP